jgi:antitoxin HicB
MIYLLKAEADDNGTVLVTCPAFPEVTTFAEDDVHVRRNGLDAIEEAIAGRIADGENLPAPAKPADVARHKGIFVKLPFLTKLKAKLYNALRHSEIE